MFPHASLEKFPKDEVALLFRLLKFLLQFILVIAILTGSVYAYAKYIEPFSLKENSISVSSPLIGKEADGLTVAVFSDTHFGEFYTVEDFEEVLKSIETARPDMVLFLGDLIDHYDRYILSEDTREISRALAKINAPLGKYAVFGNHDYEGGAEYAYENIMTAGGFTVLKNQSIQVGDSALQLVAIDELLVGYGDPAASAQADSHSFTILMCHEPDIIDEIMGEPFQLMLAGHTHGGQISTPFSSVNQAFLPAKGKKYVKGSYTFQSLEDDGSSRRTDLYVTTGIGMTQLPLRFACRPEVLIVTLHNGETNVSQ